MTDQRKPATPLSQTERRRSQRINLVTPLEVSWHTTAGDYVSEQAVTLSVNAHGALLRMKHPLPVGEVLKLTRGPRFDWALARVVHSGSPASEGKTEVAVELATPRMTFWDLTTPG